MKLLDVQSVVQLTQYVNCSVDDIHRTYNIDRIQVSAAYKTGHVCVL